MADDSYKLYMMASVNKDKQCNIVKPFNWANLEVDYNSVTKKPNTVEDIDAFKSAFIRANNSANGEIIQCCDPNSAMTNIDAPVLNDYKSKFPSVREIMHNGIVKYIEVSTKKQDPTKGWTELTPYILCRLGKAAIEPTNIPNIYRATELTPDCYKSSCNGVNTLTFEHLFNTVKADLTYSYYDDAKVVDSIKSGNVSGVEQYLRKYNNVNLVLSNDDYENRVIHIAAMYYKPKVLDLLLAVKPDLNAVNAEGNTPLHLACKYGNLDVISQLIKVGGVTLNPKNKKGETPIMLAVAYKDNPKKDKNMLDVNSMMVRYLYNNGASLLDTDNAGNTLLHHIIKYAPDTAEKSNLVRFVLERGVDPEVVNEDGVTALELTAKLIKKYEPEPKYKGPRPTNITELESPFITEPEIKYKPNSPFPIKTYNISNSKPGFVTKSNSSNVNISSDNSIIPQIETDINLTTMDRLKKWLFTINPEITLGQVLLGNATKPTTTTAGTTTTTAQAGVTTTTQSGTTTTAQAGEPTTTTAGVTTTAQAGEPTTTTAIKEPFQVNERDIAKLDPKHRELLEIQTIIFNNIIRNNADKYKSYINVAEIPKGAPIEVLDYMCTGNSPEIQGLENRAKCEALGGKFVKVKNPTTLVKVDLLPESDRAIDVVEEEELYYDKYPEAEPEKPLPSVRPSPTTTKEGFMNPRRASLGRQQVPAIKTNDRFTDFSGTYTSREPLNATDDMQIYKSANPEFVNNGNNLSKPPFSLAGSPASKREQKSLGLEFNVNGMNNTASHPEIISNADTIKFASAARMNSLLLEPVIGLDNQVKCKKVNVLVENWQYVLSFVLLIIILMFVVKVWFKPVSQRNN